MRMLQLALLVFSRAVSEVVEPLKSFLGISAFAALVVICGICFTWARKGPGGVKVDLSTLLSGALPPLVLATVGLLLWHLIRIPYLAYEKQRQAAITASTTIAALDAELEQKRHALSPTDPAYHNTEGILRAFMAYRRAIGADTNGKLLITAHAESNQIEGAVRSLAVLGSNIGNGNLLNIGVKPQDRAVEEIKGMVDGKLVIHAPPDEVGVDALVTALSNFIQTERSYQMPNVNVPSPVVWLQFGRGVVWNSQGLQRRSR